MKIKALVFLELKRVHHTRANSLLPSMLFPPQFLPLSHDCLKSIFPEKGVQLVGRKSAGLKMKKPEF